MDLQLKDIEPLLLSKLPAGRKERLIKELSTLFTRRRENLESYVTDREFVSAYTLFYLISNMRKLEFLLKQLPTSVLSDLKKLPLIDYGCGPGTYGLAWADAFGEDHAEIYQIDKSLLMLEQSQKIIANFVSTEKFIWSSHLPSLQEECVLLFGNSMNEMSDAQLFSLIESLPVRYLVFIEPGTKEVFQRMQNIREKLLAVNYQTLYPCLGNSQCAIKVGSDNWCHQVIHTTYATDYESLCQRIHRDRRTMPATIFLFHRDTTVENEQISSEVVSARMLRVFRETKYSIIYEVCLLADNQQLELCLIEVMKRNYKKRIIKKLLKLDSGMKLFFTLQKRIKERHWRVELVGDYE